MVPDKGPWDPWEDNDEPEEFLMLRAQSWVRVASSRIILSLPQALAVLITNSFLFSRPKKYIHDFFPLQLNLVLLSSTNIY